MQDNILDANEDDQLQAAISMSLQQSRARSQKNPAAYDSSDEECGSEDLETFSDSDSEAETEKSVAHKNSKRTLSKPNQCKKQTAQLSQSRNKKTCSDAEVLKGLCNDGIEESNSSEGSKKDSNDSGNEERTGIAKNNAHYDQNYKSYLGQDEGRSIRSCFF